MKISVSDSVIVHVAHCTFQLCIDYVDIAERSSVRGCQTTVGWKTRAKCDNISNSVGDRSNLGLLLLILITNMKSHVLFMAPRSISRHLVDVSGNNC